MAKQEAKKKRKEDERKCIEIEKAEKEARKRLRDIERAEKEARKKWKEIEKARKSAERAKARENRKKEAKRSLYNNFPSL